MNAKGSRPKMEQFTVRFDAIETQKLQMLMDYFGVSRVELVRAFMRQASLENAPDELTRRVRDRELIERLRQARKR
jgi:hypothetical protein